MSAATSLAEDVELEIASDVERLERIEGEWSALVDRSSIATPFQRPDWLLSYARTFGGALCTLLLRERTRLAGLVPAVRHDGVVRMLGEGVTDYLDGVFAESNGAPRPALVRTALATLAREGADLTCLRQEAALRAPFDATREEHMEVAPALDLGDDLEHSLPRKLFDRVGYYRRRLAREGGVCAIASASELDEAIDALFRLHAARWHARGEEGVLADGRVQSFHRDVAKRLHARGVARLHVLRMEERIVSALYAFVDRGRAYYYIGGFDPSYAKLSPGVLLVAAAMEDAIASGARVFDFLRGGEPYKYAWGATDRVLYRRVLG